jgi:hypothetical protein
MLRIYVARPSRRPTNHVYAERYGMQHAKRAQRHGPQRRHVPVDLHHLVQNRSILAAFRPTLVSRRLACAASRFSVSIAPGRIMAAGTLELTYACFVGFSSSRRARRT